MLPVYRATRDAKLSDTKWEQLNVIPFDIDEHDVFYEPKIDETFFHRKYITKLMSCLSENEKAIVLMRGGIIDGEPKRLQDVGIAFGCTRERIRQIESRAHEKIRQYVRHGFTK